MTTTAIFCLRVCTLYESRPRVGRFILAAFWASIAAQFTISSVSLSRLIPRIGTINGHCATIRPATSTENYTVAIAYIAATPCEIVIILATVYHAMNTKRVIFNTSAVWPILRRLYTDGVFWFVIELSLRLWGFFQWLFCPPDLKYSSDHLIYALQTIIAGRFFLAFRRHIGNSTSATADVVHVSPSGKAAVGLGMGSSTFSSSFPSFRPGASDQEVITSVTSARNRQGEQSRFQSINPTTQDGRSTQPYSLTTFDEEGIQISFNLPQEYELEVLRPGPRQDESTVRNIDASHYDPPSRRTNSESRAVVSTVGVRESP
ncbi:hypothetical protein FRB91_011273 [Serendipita sp. 411]|nr:hypothetical protein FRB91_011273 [Serendipita sp. 411]